LEDDIFMLAKHFASVFFLKCPNVILRPDDTIFVSFLSLSLPWKPTNLKKGIASLGFFAYNGL